MDSGGFPTSFRITAETSQSYFDIKPQHDQECVTPTTRIAILRKRPLLRRPPAPELRSQDYFSSVYTGEAAWRRNSEVSVGTPPEHSESPIVRNSASVADLRARPTIAVRQRERHKSYQPCDAQSRRTPGSPQPINKILNNLFRAPQIPSSLANLTQARRRRLQRRRPTTAAPSSRTSRNNDSPSTASSGSAESSSSETDVFHGRRESMQSWSGKPPRSSSNTRPDLGSTLDMTVQLNGAAAATSKPLTSFILGDISSDDEMESDNLLQDPPEQPRLPCSGVNIPRLPFPIVFGILKHLDNDTSRSARLVCRTWLVIAALAKGGQGDL